MNKLSFLFSALLFIGMAHAQNVGIGTSTPLQKLHVEGSSFLNGNVGVGENTPAFPISFGPALGDKISLWSNSTNSYGFGIQSSLLQIHTDIAAADIAFGYGSSSAFTESMRIKGNGNVGIGTTAPLQKLHVEGTTFLNGNVGIGTSTPFAHLTFNNSSSGEIISFNGTAGNNYGIGVQIGLLQIHSNVEAADIAFGHGSSTSFTERARIINTGTDGLILKGRLHIKNGSNPVDVNATGGVWLYKSDNSALLGFMGTQNNQNIGFYGGPVNGGWGFVYNAINSRVGIGTSNPSDKLHVEGTTFLNGDVGIGGLGPAGHRLVVSGTTFLDGNVGIGTFAGSNRLVVNGPTLVNGPTVLSGPVGIGTSTPGHLLDVNGGIQCIALIQTSDTRLKKGIVPIQNSLQKITQLNGYNYYWKNENTDNSLQTGVLAQEVQKIFPNLVKEGKDGMLAVNYSGLIPVMIESIKEQQKQIDELKKLVEKSLK
jgi:Chaperone of endosialidase